MNKSCWVFLFFCCSFQFLLAQRNSVYEENKFQRTELQRYSRLSQLAKELSLGQEGFDVTYYKLDLRLIISPNGLRGSVTIIATSIVDNLASMTLDLMNTMVVDSVQAGGARVSVTQQTSTINISLNRSYNKGEKFTAIVYYHGVPGSSGFGSFAFGTAPSGSPWIWSLSEPYGAKDWWPSKDHPGDKADSVDVWITCDQNLKVGSQGKLVATINNGDGTVTYKWQHRYPIATYLVSIAAANYTAFSYWFRYSPTDSMEILNYVLPERAAEAQQQNQLPLTAGMLGIYSNLYGLYPFIKEKYGHSHFGWGGGMEHQTMTSLGGFSESLVAHELAHQWFGDMITMKTWPDIWLNEGFATYSVALYFEKKYNQEAYWSYMNNQMQRARSANGSVYVRDTSSVGNLFNGNLVYAKGATVLHMLRHVLGDSVFFRAIKRYANDNRYRFNVASTEDFRAECEAESGKNLSYFFNEWIYGENYPRYNYEWSAIKQDANYVVTISINQTTNTTSPLFFTMPIDFRITGTFLDTTVTLLNNSQNQVFTLTLPRKPTSVLLDPAGWILKDVPNESGASPIPVSYELYQNYPNPFNPGTAIGFDLPQRSVVTIKIYDALGREVTTLLNERREAGYHEVKWNPSSNTSGIYFCRLFIDDKPFQVRKMIFLR